MEGGTSVAAASCSSFVATAFLVAAFRFFVFAARLRADFSFRFRTAFFAADLLPLGMGIPFASYLPHLPVRKMCAVLRPYNS
jgi:hypothetical protein